MPQVLKLTVQKRTHTHSLHDIYPQCWKFTLSPATNINLHSPAVNLRQTINDQDHLYLSSIQCKPWFWIPFTLQVQLNECEIGEVDTSLDWISTLGWKKCFFRRLQTHREHARPGLTVKRHPASQWNHSRWNKRSIYQNSCKTLTIKAE